MTFPLLYHKGKSGALYEWLIYTKGPVIYTQYGQVGGTLQITPGKVCAGKNLGKSNETSADEQANLEAQAMWTFKKERKYSLTPDEAQEEMMFPMLAQDFEKKKKKVTYPAMIQPKLDGVRCLARWNNTNTDVELVSRSGKLYNVVHIAEQLRHFMPKGCVLDGELYVHGEDFENVTSWVKKPSSDSYKIQYWVYDVPEFIAITDLTTTNRTWEQRLAILNGLFGSEPNYHNILFVRTLVVPSEAAVYEWQKKFVGEGYEGAIVRTNSGLYRYNYRSDDLLKVKSFDDDEFEIVGFTEGVGKDSDTVIWICKTGHGKEFAVRPKGTYKQRSDWYKKGASFIGEELKVKFFGYTNGEVPRFPIGLGFRDEKDK